MSECTQAVKPCVGFYALFLSWEAKPQNETPANCKQFCHHFHYEEGILPSSRCAFCPHSQQLLLSRAARSPRNTLECLWKQTIMSVGLHFLLIIFSAVNHILYQLWAHKETSISPLVQQVRTWGLGAESVQIPVMSVHFLSWCWLQSMTQAVTE